MDRRAKRAGGNRTAAERWPRLLAALILTFIALASAYVAQGMLTRVWPALFPGQSNPVAIQIPSADIKIPAGPAVEIPGIPTLGEPGADSAFNAPRTFVVVGLDKRPGQPEFGEYRTDVIMIATIDPVSKSATLLSIPRDLLVEIELPDGSIVRDRINESYRQGLVATGSIKGGAEQLVSDIEHNFGVSTDYWAVIDMTGAESLLSSVSPISVDIPPEIAVPRWWYSDDDKNAHWVSFPPGDTELSAYDAVAFARYRGDSDLARIKRQQLVLRAAMANTRTQELLQNSAGMWRAYQDAVSTNLSAGELVGMAPLISQLRSDMQTYSLGDPVNGVPTVRNFVTADGAWVLTWDPNNVAYWLELALGDDFAGLPDAAGRSASTAAPDNQRSPN